MAPPDKQAYYLFTRLRKTGTYYMLVTMGFYKPSQEVAWWR